MWIGANTYLETSVGDFQQFLRVFTFIYYHSCFFDYVIHQNIPAIFKSILC